MTLQSSGTISMSQINTELGRSSTANISLDTAENGGYGAINIGSTSRPSSNNPAAMSEWYGYNHNAVTATTDVNVALSGYGGADAWLQVRNANTNALVIDAYNPGFNSTIGFFATVPVGTPLFVQGSTYYFGFAYFDMSVFIGSNEVFYQNIYGDPPYLFYSFNATSEPIQIYGAASL